MNSNICPDSTVRNEPPEKRRRIDSPDSQTDDQNLSNAEKEKMKDSVDEISDEKAADVEPSTESAAQKDDQNLSNAESEKKSDSVEEIFDDDYSRSSEEETDDEEDRKKEVPLEAFNMDEEKDLGSFDNDGNFIWKSKSREPMDAWLAYDGVKPVYKNIILRKSPQSVVPDKMEFRKSLEDIASYMQNEETVQAAIHRMSNPVASSASARLALKKAGGSYRAVGSSAKMQSFLNLVTQVPLTCSIYELKKRQIQEIIYTKAKMEKFYKMAFPPRAEVVSISSSDSEDEDNRTVSISSSDEDEVKEIGNEPRSANGGENVARLIEDMFED